MVSLRGWLPDVRNPLNIRPSAKPPVGQSSTGGAFCLSKTLWASTTFKSGALAKQRPKTWNMEQYWTVAVLMNEKQERCMKNMIVINLHYCGQSCRSQVGGNNLGSTFENVNVNFQKTLITWTERSQVPLKTFKSELRPLWWVAGNEQSAPLFAVW